MLLVKGRKRRTWERCPRTAKTVRMWPTLDDRFILPRLNGRLTSPAYRSTVRMTNIGPRRRHARMNSVGAQRWTRYYGDRIHHFNLTVIHIFTFLFVSSRVRNPYSTVHCRHPPGTPVYCVPYSGIYNSTVDVRTTNAGRDCLKVITSTSVSAAAAATATNYATLPNWMRAIHHHPRTGFFCCRTRRLIKNNNIVLLSSRSQY